MIYTTLKLLQENNPCSEGMETLVSSFPKKPASIKLISLAHILKSNGLNHALWALRATTVDCRKIAVRMAIEFAYQSLSNFEKAFPEDKGPRTALEAAASYLDGKISLKELEAAAWSAAWSAASAAEKQQEKIFLKLLEA